MARTESCVANLEKVDHIVVLMMENRSFDHMLGYLSLTGGRADIDGLRPGLGNEYLGRSYPVHHLATTKVGVDPSHTAGAVDVQVDGGRMGGFVASLAATMAGGGVHGGDPSPAVGYYDGADVPVYDHLAEEFLVCDRWFSSVPGATWPSRLYALCGSAAGSRDDLSPHVPPMYHKPSFVWGWWGRSMGRRRCPPGVPARWRRARRSTDPAGRSRRCGGARDAAGRRTHSREGSVPRCRRSSNTARARCRAGRRPPRQPAACPGWRLVLALRAIQTCWSSWAAWDQPGKLPPVTGVMWGCTKSSALLTEVTTSTWVTAASPTLMGARRRRARSASHLALVAAGLPAENAQSWVLRWPQMRRNAASALAAPVSLPMRRNTLSRGFGRPPLVQAVPSRRARPGLKKITPRRAGPVAACFTAPGCPRHPPDWPRGQEQARTPAPRPGRRLSAAPSLVCCA